MNPAFQNILSLSRNQARNLTHQQQVTRLYRNALKCAFSWTMDRELFLQEAERIRARFEAARNVPESQGKALLSDGEKELEEHYHPDKYVVAWMPGGSKFMRNSPIPMDVVFNGEEVPKEYFEGTNTQVWPDQVPVTWRSKEEVTGYVVDFSKKTLE